MTRMFKVFRAEVNSFFHTIGENDAFRTTGDCSICDHSVDFK